jgi:hypothetical protein
MASNGSVRKATPKQTAAPARHARKPSNLQRTLVRPRVGGMKRYQTFPSGKAQSMPPLRSIDHWIVTGHTPHRQRCRNEKRDYETSRRPKLVNHLLLLAPIGTEKSCYESCFLSRRVPWQSANEFVHFTWWVTFAVRARDLKSPPTLTDTDITLRVTVVPIHLVVKSQPRVRSLRG